MTERRTFSANKLRTLGKVSSVLLAFLGTPNRSIAEVTPHTYNPITQTETFPGLIPPILETGGDTEIEKINQKLAAIFNILLRIKSEHQLLKEIERNEVMQLITALIYDQIQESSKTNSAEMVIEAQDVTKRITKEIVSEAIEKFKPISQE